MIQTYMQLNNSIIEFNKLVEKKPAQIQKIFSSAYTIDIVARLPGETVHLIVGRGKICEGVLIENSGIPSPFRKQDKFLSYLRKALTNTALLGLELDSKDRCFKIRYGKWQKENSINIFYNGQALYFSHDYYSEKEDRFVSFKSWTLKIDDEQASFDAFKEVGRKNIADKKKIKKSFSLSDILKLEEKRSSSSTLKSKKKKKLLRKIDNIQNDFDKVKRFDQLEEWVEKESDFSQYPPKYTFAGVKFNFKFKEHFKRRNQVYEKIKAHKKAQKLLEGRLQATKNELDSLASEDIFFELSPVAPFWGKLKVRRDGDTGGLNYKVLNFSDFTLGVGTSAKGNDQLRSKFASKNDLWFHLDSMESPHVILKGEVEINEELLNIVGSVLLDFGKYSLANVGIIYTKVKDIKGVKGSPGKVIFKKERRFYATQIDWRSLLVD